MNSLNSWKSEDDEINWTPYKYRTIFRKSIKESEAQYSNRAKFSLANSILNPIRPIIKVSFVKYNKGRKSGYNTAVGLFLTNAIRGDYPNLEVNFSAMEFSKGTLPGLDKWEFHVKDNKVSLTWNSALGKRNAYQDDRVYLLLFNVCDTSFIPVTDWIKRADKKIDLTIPTSQKTEYAAWAFLVNRTNTNSSNSHFLGRFKMAP